MNSLLVVLEETSSSFGWGLDNTRNLLHLIGVIVWVGGLILMGALMPVVKQLGPEVAPKLARQFSRVAWPAFYLAILTGLWNLGSDWADSDNSWRIVISIKLLLVAITGLTAWYHLKATDRVKIIVSAAITLVLSIVLVILGIGLGN